jgi:ATP-binding cassette subfamily B protein
MKSHKRRNVPQHVHIDRPKAKSARPLRAIIPFIRPYLGRLILSLLVLVAASGAILSLPVALRYLIDSGLASGDTATINRYFAILMGVIVLFAILGALRFYLIMWLGERVVADIRNKVYFHVIHQDPTFFEVTQTGEVLSRLTSDTALIQSISGAGISIVLRSTVMFIGALTGLLITSPKLAGMIFLLVPTAVGPVIWIARKVRKLSRKSQDRLAESSGLANETLNAIQTVQAFTLERLQSQRFWEAVEETFHAGLRRIRVRAVMTGGGMLILFGIVTLVLWIGTLAVMDGDITKGELGQFLLLTLFLASSGMSLTEQWGEVQRAAGAMERLVELIEAEPAIKAPANPVPLPVPGRGKIAFEDVTFNYPSRPDDRALNQFSVDIEPGETIAFVGPSGAGKSTTFQLLLRFYDPASGVIRIDDVDITEADPEQVRQRIGVVPQETVIFGTSARENIRYGRPDATDAEVEDAAKVAEIDVFLRSLPDGYDTFLGEHGMRLSGGQRQRVAIARAILRNPPILLLDEATSSLDAESERLVQEALEHLMQNRTTIIIAHRLATVLKAQRIVVMDEGQIVDIGTHAELVQRDPLYARLAELQFGDRAEQAQTDRLRVHP